MENSEWSVGEYRYFTTHHLLLTIHNSQEYGKE
jgi:hypothetical protein